MTKVIQFKLIRKPIKNLCFFKAKSKGVVDIAFNTNYYETVSNKYPKLIVTDCTAWLINPLF